MRTVAATLEVVIGAQIEAALLNFLLNQVVDAGILRPVRGTDPNVRDVTYLSEHLFQIRSTSVFDIRDEQLVGTQANEDVVGLILGDKFFQAIRLSPNLRGAAIPNDLDQGVAVLIAILCQTRRQALEHRVTDEEDILGRSVQGGTPCLGT